MKKCSGLWRCDLDFEQQNLLSEAWLAVSSSRRGFCVQFVDSAQAHLPWTIGSSLVAKKVLTQGQHIKIVHPLSLPVVIQRATRIPSVFLQGVAGGPSFVEPRLAADFQRERDVHPIP